MNDPATMCQILDTALRVAWYPAAVVAGAILAWSIVAFWRMPK